MKTAERAAGGRGASGEEQAGGAPGAGLGAGEGPEAAESSAWPGRGRGWRRRGGVRRRTKVAARATADFGALRSNVRVFRQDECVLRSTFVYEDGPGRWEEGERESREDTGGGGGHCGHPGKRSWRFAWTPRGGGQDARTFERPSGRSEIIPRDARALSAGDAHKGVAARLWRYFPRGKRQAGRPTAERGVCGGGSPGLGVGRTAGRRRVPSARAAAPTEAPAAASSIGGRSAPPRRGAGLPGLATGQLSHRSDVR